MFLHLKKKYHMNKPVKIKLLSDTFDIKAERNQYDNMQYTAKTKNVGEDYPQGFSYNIERSFFDRFL